MAEEPIASTKALTEKKGETGDGTSGRIGRALYIDDAPLYFEEVPFRLRTLI